MRSRLIKVLNSRFYVKVMQLEKGLFVLLNQLQRASAYPLEPLFYSIGFEYQVDHYPEMIIKMTFRKQSRSSKPLSYER